MTSLTNRSLELEKLAVSSKSLPTMYDLPSEYPEEPGLPDEFHDLQPQLLSRTLSLRDYSALERFTGSDMNVYYDTNNVNWHKRPDWFLAVGVPRVYNGERGEDMRKSYVVWDEGKSPTVIIEFLSYRTEKEDLGRFYGEADFIADPDPGSPQSLMMEKYDLEQAKPPRKLRVYEEYLKTPHYIVYSKSLRRLRYFKHNGSRYEEQPVKENAPCIWLDDLHIGLGIWNDYFEEIPGPWLRWCDRDGNWLLTDTEQERAEKERVQAEAKQERAEKEKLRDKLRELGFDPEDL